MSEEIFKEKLKITIEDTHTTATIDINNPSPHITEYINAIRSAMLSVGFCTELVDEYIPYCDIED